MKNGEFVGTNEYEDIVNDPLLNLVLNKIKIDRSRYETLAEGYLLEKEVTYEYSDFILNFSKERRGVAIRVSEDDGKSYFYRGWYRLGQSRSTKIEELIFNFALEESRLSE